MKKVILGLTVLAVALSADVFVKMTENEYHKYMKSIVEKKGYIDEVKTSHMPEKSALIVMTVKGEVVAEIVETLSAKNEGFRQDQFLKSGSISPKSSNIFLT
ncbi:MAG: hypothetical protein COB67_00530 [SAR324 cluster bacterium]|uniref:Uncharacterized protein n=1 Tax=SAR324 cluster bacterium TaxID=2024889 RepID=A0A2A4TC78_9DELT|nr:MAG: hypothetical protein COB67_00530 [SAR324 cluster bacterium]